jgi:hypothetical protein
MAEDTLEYMQQRGSQIGDLSSLMSNVNALSYDISLKTSIQGEKLIKIEEKTEEVLETQE